MKPTDRISTPPGPGESESPPDAPDETVTDPVCGTVVDAAAVEAEAEPSEVTFDGVRYLFCSDACRSAFEADPRRYALRLSRDDDARA